MLKFIGRRFVGGAFLLLGIAVVAFSLLYMSGGDITRRILGEAATDEAVLQKSAELGLDRPLHEQFWSWLVGAVTGDLGRSWFSGQAVTGGIQSRLAVTLSIIVGAVIVIAIVSVILGLLAATRRGWVDRVVQVISLIGFAIPGFLFALALVLIFAIGFGWFQPTGYIPFFTSPAGWVSTVTLPVVALSLSGIASVTQQIRGSVIDALRNDYVRTLRSRGMSERRIIFKHVLRNAAGPALAVLAVYFVGLLGGAVIVEQVFAIPGLGQVAVQATTQGDIPMVMGLVMAVGILVILFNLLVDLMQGWLNPKVRLS
ncbi:ABC transporter permease [Okibacterium endophyticum]